MLSSLRDTESDRALLLIESCPTSPSRPKALPGERERDLLRFTSFLDFGPFRPTDPSSTTNEFSDVAAVEYVACVNFEELFIVVVVAVVSVRTVEERLTADFARR